MHKASGGKEDHHTQHAFGSREEDHMHKASGGKEDHLHQGGGPPASRYCSYIDLNIDLGNTYPFLVAVVVLHFFNLHHNQWCHVDDENQMHADHVTHAVLNLDPYEQVSAAATYLDLNIDASNTWISLQHLHMDFFITQPSCR